MSAALESLVRELGLVQRLMFAIEAHAPCSATEAQVIAALSLIPLEPAEARPLLADLVRRLDAEPSDARVCALLVSSLVRNEASHEELLRLAGLLGGTQ